ncbi:Transcriptional regulatory protein UME6 [Tolypocladium ophioglossoides CBS 100239]|uniref:Transcriptional regulatory protein UME6 n=1 Tax=Tolypocladium ophioglossoides (strain CBS 100239) TaxID=1163406 RepID=A0A0L0N4T8_TOLOC|nr:Transcriptional regulatory protein UME6 [Tolypocladium ophioglossoides CBS 100239]
MDPLIAEPPPRPSRSITTICHVAAGIPTVAFKFIRDRPNGCWTCRIRHRKCDEALPTCRECSDRAIPCHGYGQKPKWLDDKALHYAELARIKRIVNRNFRRTRKRQQAELCNGRPGPREEAHAADAVPMRDGDVEGGSATTGSNQDMAFREAQLLVHYLDYIFPLQYPYYTDEPALGGRGWLFWLLMKRGPLHQAVLTLSALHHHTEFAHTSANRASELIGYHTNALQRLRQVISVCEVDRFAENREQLVEFLACGSALISFELFQGGTTNWQPHLFALVSVVNRMSPDAVACGGADLDQPLLNGIDLAQRFLVTKVIWLDVLASTATGTAPRTNYREWLDLEAFDMSRVMGCQSWAMMAIGDLSTLAFQEVEPDAEPDYARLREIELRLEEGLDGLASSTQEPSPISHALTKVFAAAALVQLRTTTTIPDTSSSERDIHHAVSRAIGELRRLPSWVSVRGLAWPISVVGAVAAPDQQSFFEDLLQHVLQKAGSGFTNCGTVLRVLRRCWKHRGECPDEVWT